MSASAANDADPVEAFVPEPRLRIAGAEGNLPLAGLTFGAKDLFDVAGHVTGCGNPDWKRTHPPATATAPAVQMLLDHGATLVGKTKTQELAYGLTGENIWEGTPVNPAVPPRFPGGSSSGSAAAVGGRLCDFALGTDTGGSVRIPASYCGIWGIRPSHGAISLAGVMPLAPSYDTVGWFARDAATLERVGSVLLPAGGGGVLGPLLVVTDAWENADAGVREVLTPLVRGLERVFGPPFWLKLPWPLQALYESFRFTQAAEAWTCLGPWVERTGPQFGPGVAERFQAAKANPPDKATAGRAFRSLFSARVRALLAGGAVMVFPTAPAPALYISADARAQQMMRERILTVTAISGLAGLCEVSMPLGKVEDAPVGLSLAAGPGRDRALLAMVAHTARVLGL